MYLGAGSWPGVFPRPVRQVEEQNRTWWRVCGFEQAPENRSGQVRVPRGIASAVLVRAVPAELGAEDQPADHRGAGGPAAVGFLG